MTVQVPDGFSKMEMSPTWDYKAEGENATLRGVYISTEEDVGPNNSKLYTFEKSNGERVAVWGNTILDTRLKNLQLGEEVFIVYLGQVASEVKGRSPYNNFEVWHKGSPEVVDVPEGFGK